jgi:Fur family iron response transcriptional regulator
MDTNQITQTLREKGITPTNQRVRIASLILEKPWHFSAEQLLEITNRDAKVASKATIYNTLELFTRKGLIKQLVVDPERVYYDSTTHPHYHYFDAETQQLIDIEPGEVDIRLPETLPPGMEVAGVDLVIQVRPQGH